MMRMLLLALVWLNNQNLALEVKMLSETLEKYKQLYHELQNKYNSSSIKYRIRVDH